VPFVFAVCACAIYAALRTFSLSAWRFSASALAFAFSACSSALRFARSAFSGYYWMA
jgi:hypothetical protein